MFKFDVTFQEVRVKTIRVECDDEFLDSVIDELEVEFAPEDVVYFGADYEVVEEE